MNLTLIILLGSQLLFATSDLLGRYYMLRMGFSFASFATFWFIAYLTIRTIATFGQLYVFTQMEMGRTITLFAASGLILANILGYLFLDEILNPTAYIGITLAILAFIILALR